MEKNKFIAGVSLLIAITVVMQSLSVLLIKIAGFGFNLVLIPIVIACIFYGVKGGTIVGAAFGLTAFIHCVLGWDGFGALFFASDWLLTLLTVFGRGVVVGFVIALIYKAFNRSLKNNIYLIIIVSLLASIINTGLFIILGYNLFYGLLEDFAKQENATNVLKYLIGLITPNFIFEISTTAIFCPAIVKALEKSKKLT